MKTLIIVLCLILSPVTQAAYWLPIGASEAGGVTVYIDLESIKINAGSVFVWTKYQHNVYSYNMLFEGYHCTNDTTVVLRAIHYEGGSVTQDWENSKPYWKTIVPESLNQGVKRFVCDLPVQKPVPQATQPLKKVGQCIKTSVTEVGTRLIDSETRQPMPGSGTSIKFANGISLVDYDTVPEAAASKLGDIVKMCLISVPKKCPPGDNRGKIYTVTNLRTMKSFTMPDSQHSCGGA